MFESKLEQPLLDEAIENGDVVIEILPAQSEAVTIPAEQQLWRLLSRPGVNNVVAKRVWHYLGVDLLNNPENPMQMKPYFRFSRELDSFDVDAFIRQYRTSFAKFTQLNKEHAAQFNLVRGYRATPKLSISTNKYAYRKLLAISACLMAVGFSIGYLVDALSADSRAHKLLLALCRSDCAAAYLNEKLAFTCSGDFTYYVTHHAACREIPFSVMQAVTAKCGLDLPGTASVFNDTYGCDFLTQTMVTVLIAVPIAALFITLMSLYCSPKSYVNVQYRLAVYGEGAFSHRQVMSKKKLSVLQLHANSPLFRLKNLSGAPSDSVTENVSSLHLCVGNDEAYLATEEGTLVDRLRQVH